MTDRKGSGDGLDEPQPPMDEQSWDRYIEGGLEVRRDPSRGLEKLLGRIQEETRAEKPISSSQVRPAKRAVRSSGRAAKALRAGSPWQWVGAAAAAAAVVAALVWSMQGGAERPERPERREVVRRAGDRREPEPESPALELPPETEAAHPGPETQKEPLPEPAPTTLVEDEPEAAPEHPEPEIVVENREAEPETAKLAARVGKLTGLVYCRRRGAGKWFKATAGLPLEAGDELDTRSAQAEVVFENGTKALCNKSTWVGAGAGTLEIKKRGEVYCEVAEAAKGKFAVVTEHVRVTDLGTRFGVDVGARGTLVTVAEGEVEARNDHGSVVVSENQQSRTGSVRAAPGEAKDVDSAKALAWALEGKLAGAPGWQVAIAEDFSAVRPGEVPQGWEYRDLRKKGTPDQWQVVTDGRERLLRWGGRAEGYIVLAGGREFADVELSFRFKAESWTGGLGFALRGDCWHSGYELNLNGQGVSLVRSDRAGVDVSLAPAVKKTIDAGKWHRVTMRVVGDEITVLLNGEEVIAGVRDTTYGKGPVTLDGIRQKADFDDVRVRTLTTRQ